MPARTASKRAPGRSNSAAVLARWKSSTPSGRVTLVPLVVRLGPCAIETFVVRGLDPAIEAGGCVAAHAGAIGALARDLPGENLERWQPWIAGALRAVGGLRFDRLVLRLDAELGVAALAPAFYVQVGADRVFVDRPGPVWASVAVSVIGRWRP